MTATEPRTGVTLGAAEVVVSYDGIDAVRGVTLTLRPGELVALTGPSGAGKSSLISVLAGVIRPARGTVQLGHARIGDRDESIARGIALIPQGNVLVRIFTAAENVAVPLARRREVPDVRAAALDALRAVGLEDAADQLVEELSGGQQQRAAVARGLAEHGVFLLADEPTSELDAGNRERVMALLRAEAERGAGVLVATHDPVAAEVCDAELRLDEGVGEWIRDDR